MNSGSRYVSYDPVDSPLITVVGLGVYYARPAPTRSFPILTNGSGDVVYPEFAYPVRGRVFSLRSSSNRFQLRKNIIPIYAAALLAFFVPFVFFVLFQIRIRSPHHLLGSTMGLLESLM
jgi:diacylglycerol diphosphate phosphatase/phosphatidate phosphatase